MKVNVLDSSGYSSGTQCNSFASFFLSFFSDFLPKLKLITLLKGDVSNKNSKDTRADDAVKHTTTATAALRRSRRLSTGNRMPSNNNPEPILAASAAVAPQKNNKNDRNVSKKRERKSEAAATTSSNTQQQQQQQQDNDDDFDIEESLLEPKPKRKRERSTTTTRGKKRRSRKNVDLKICVDPQTPEGVVSTSSLLSSNSAIRLNPTNRCTDLLITEDDDYCLLRKVEGPFDPSKYTTGIAIYDKDYKENVDEVPDYVTDIFQRLFDAEVRIFLFVCLFASTHSCSYLACSLTKHTYRPSPHPHHITSSFLFSSLCFVFVLSSKTGNFETIAIVHDEKAK